MDRYPDLPLTSYIILLQREDEYKYRSIPPGYSAFIAELTKWFPNSPFLTKEIQFPGGNPLNLSFFLIQLPSIKSSFLFYSSVFNQSNECFGRPLNCSKELVLHVASRRGINNNNNQSLIQYYLGPVLPSKCIIQ